MSTGPSTPFDNVAAAIKLRNLIRGELESLSGGDRVASQMLSMDPDKLATVGHFAAIGQRFRAFPAPLRHWFDERSIDALMSALRSEIAIMQRALDIDRDYALAGLYLSVKEIAEIATLLAQRERIVQTLSRSTLVHAIEHFGRSIAEIEQANNAIDWIRSVRRAAPRGRLSEVLTSSTVSNARGMLREAAAKGAPLFGLFTTLMTKATRDFGMTGLQDLEPKTLTERLDLLLVHRTELADYMAIRDQRRELEAVGLSDMLACADHVALSLDRLPSLFETLVAQGRADLARRAAPPLARQNGATLEARRRAFAERDRKKIETDRVMIRTGLLQKTPLPGTDAGPRRTWTEMALLRKEFAKQRRFTPVRGLLSRAGRSIQVLKPCFMMSPLSLAKFVGPGALEFDILLIDEASQMRPEDALGGMLRAKQIVVVGDSKQLPPTDFFTRSEVAASSDDEFEDIDDESILEGCEKTFRDVRRLKWHYRSRCESLIAFSNAEFYRDSPLITFPTARPGSFSIDLVRVDGPYQARRNVAEAVRMVEEAIQFMRYFSDKNEDIIPTLGLAAVNIEQRDLIQEELRRLSATDELVDLYCEKVEKKGEPLFVKNLENVQGDERDFIFISLTYGREPGATVMKQRFGPINGKQGHRRLNVLFSRARERIILFTSFGSADVRPSGTSAKGVHVLKRYLEYAERRGLAVERIGSEPDSDFEVEVRDRLRSRGYEIDCQVGVSGYRIDLGVRHPDNPETFLAGIECDGARYHGTPSARDRDRLREEVLRGLGWEILRVWSIDWFDDPGLETEKLVKKLEQLRSQPRRTFDDYCIVVKGSEPQEEPVDEPILQENFADGAGAAAPTNEGVPPPSAPTSEPAGADATSLLASDDPLTEAQAFDALKAFRETIIKREMTDWEPHRSILRDGMIETFVRQRVTDPEDWFRKVPQFQRSGTNPVEKNQFLSRICDIVDRIEERRPVTRPKPDEPYTLTSSTPQQSPTEPRLPLGAPMSPARGQADPSPTVIEYVIADMAELGITPRADRFYDPDYAVTIRQMVAHIIEVESPIYDDLLVARIARAHRFQRSGNNIQQRVLSAIDRRFPRSEEDGRKVLWREGSRTDAPVAYRSGSSDVRSHWYIPIAELASLAIPYVRLRMDDEQVLRKMADHFELGRLREATRRRFQRAISFAKSSVSSRP